VGGGIWGSSGISSDGTSLFVTTGNSKASATSGLNTAPSTWGDGESVYKLPTTLAPPSMTSTTDLFVPSNWTSLDTADQDIGGTGPVLFDIPGANPSKLLMALGKDGNAYLLDRTNLGGMDAQALAKAPVATGIIDAAVAYRTALASYVVFINSGAPMMCPSGQTGGLSAIKISATSPPTMSVAWCGGPATNGSAMVTMTTAAGANTIVWVYGQDQRIHGLDGDTGQSVYSGAPTPLVQGQPIQAPIVAKGRIFLGTPNQIYAFTPN